MAMTSTEKAFWRRLCEKFEEVRGDLDCDVFLGPATLPPKAKGSFVQVLIASDKQVHYEWVIRNGRFLDVALHFECPRREASMAWLKLFDKQLDSIKGGSGHGMQTGAFGEKCAEICYRIPFEGSTPALKHAEEAAEAMTVLIEKTFGVLSGNLDLPKTCL
jgi:hypothetical protein